MDENSLINKIQDKLGPPSRRVWVGIGDDAAVCTPPQGRLVTTVDCLVEGVHFDLDYFVPKEVGYKALAVNLSDIASMGAEPLYAVVSLGVPEHLNEEAVLEVYAGIKHLAYEFEVDIVGGNLSQSPEQFWIDVTVIGEAKDGLLTRDGARLGDILAVTGPLGNSAAGLMLLNAFGRDAVNRYPALTNSHLLPEPRIREAQALKETGAITAMMDISDSLAKDLYRMSQASNLSFSLTKNQLPISTQVQQAATELGCDALDWALYGGEDYELLLTIDPNKVDEAAEALQYMGKDLMLIGTAQENRHGNLIIGPEGPEPIKDLGWDHFSNSNNETQLD